MRWLVLVLLLGAAPALAQTSTPTETRTRTPTKTPVATWTETPERECEEFLLYAPDPQTNPPNQAWGKQIAHQLNLHSFASKCGHGGTATETGTVTATATRTNTAPTHTPTNSPTVTSTGTITATRTATPTSTPDTSVHWWEEELTAAVATPFVDSVGINPAGSIVWRCIVRTETTITSTTVGYELGVPGAHPLYARMTGVAGQTSEADLYYGKPHEVHSNQVVRMAAPLGGTFTNTGKAIFRCYYTLLASP